MDGERVLKFVPRPYQNIMAEHALRYKRCALLAGMGMGKSSTVLHVIDTLKFVDRCKTLVLAPLRVAKNVWPSEVAKWDNFKGLSISPIIGDVDERRKALKKNADIHTINYENIPWLVSELKDSWPWDTIVADESTRLKSFRLRQGSVRAQVLARVAWRSERFIELTGTPAPNGLIDLWGQLWFLDKGDRLGRTYTAFVRRWFKQIVCPGFTKIDPLPGADKEIHDKIKDICVSLDAKDWFNVKDPIVVDVPVYLPETARAKYKDMEKKFFAEIAGHEIDAANSAAKSMKLLQMANGAVYTNEECSDWAVLHDEKLAALESIIEEANGMPVLVAYHFKSDLSRLRKRFPQGVVLDKNESTIRAWDAGKIPIMFIHPASAGHGLNLQNGGNILVFFSFNWNLEERQQVIERIGPVRQIQAGFDRSVYIYHIRAVDTIDDVVIERCLSKRSVQDLLLEAAKRRC